MRLLSLRRRRPRETQRGATTVEFATVFPLFFLVVAGAIEGGRFVIAHMMLSYAVIVGARAATLSGASTTTVQTAVVNAAPMLGLTASQVEITPSTLPATVGSTVTVSVGVTSSADKYAFKSLLPTLFSSRNWSAQATMVVR